MPVYKTISDEQLVLHLKDGDHAAFAEIYNRHWETMADAAYQRLRSREEAEEVVQEVFVSLYLRRAELSPKSSLIAYLKTALKYKVIDAYRAQEMHQRHIAGIVEYSITSGLVPDDGLCVKELQGEIMRIVQTLPPKCREVFVKSRFEHLSHRFIAENMGISISTVKKHLYKATETLKSKLGGNHSDFLSILLFLLYIKNS
ncbi:RNA polymerase sigma-70 factor [Mucilaginibacter sp. 44-25]|uniref:RNA polymerase sigma factor n=1 Tax=Mucilaginibacter sp. 44-25 TaxID=1895794 RepID=UPI00095A9234|nr:RNA polymerase sigma-70 factor [Mucilaginibacter sp. 44-25]OJW13199.1 MAG: hypothetical protein BGO48_00070 [Mucilaginibacter sp. 44-25]